jgi:glycosyltransferase involved in cell wall biosynthesis
VKVLCLTDFPVNPPDRWIWNHLPGVNDQVDFLWAETNDRSGRLGKFVTRYPPFWQLAHRALRQAAMQEYDLIMAWESKTGIPFALLRRLSGQTRTPFAILTFTPGEVARAFFPLVRYALGAVNHVTVLTLAEINAYHRLFGLPISRISLCLLGTYDLVPGEPPAAQNVTERPCIHASGRSARDYATLIKAAQGLPADVIIHGRGYNFADLSLPPNVSIGEMASREEYHRLVRDAAVEIVPLHDTPAPVGSSQIVFSMMMGKAIVATRTGSTIDYVEHGVTGLLVEPGDAERMRSAIRYLLAHPAEAETMGRAARLRFEERHTFEQFARSAYQILRQVVQPSNEQAQDG